MSKQQTIKAEENKEEEGKEEEEKAAMTVISVGGGVRCFQFVTKLPAEAE